MSNLSTPDVSWGRQLLSWWKATKKSRHIEAFTLLMILGLPLASVMGAIRSGSIILFCCSLAGAMALWFVGPRLMPHPRAIGARLWGYHEELLPIVNLLLAVLVAAAFPEVKTALEILALGFAFLVLAGSTRADKGV